MKALIPVLESLKICRAISLDDEYDLTTKIAGRSLMGIDEFLSAYREKFSESELDKIDEAGVSTIGDLFGGKSISPELKDKVNAILDKGEKAMPDFSALSFLAEEFEETSVSFEKIYDFWGIEYAINEGLVWFLDKEMGKRDILPEVIPRIADKHFAQTKACLVVVFTSDDSFDALNCSWQKRFDYLSGQLGLEEQSAQGLSYSFFVISKTKVNEKLVFGKESACRYIEDILVDSLYGYCIYNLIMEMEKHTQESYVCMLEAAKNARGKTIETLCYNMVAEGESNVYHALKTIQDLMQEQEYTSRFEDSNEFILAIKRLALLPKEAPEMIASRAIDDIMLQYEWTQFQFMHRDVNVALSDISYGDIFSLQYAHGRREPQSYIGVLATQPCDCIIRENKGKVQRNAQSFTLLLFERKEISRRDLLNKTQKNWKDMIRKIRNEGIFIGQEKDDHGDWIAYYIQASSCISAIYVSPFILDLTSLDSEGKSKLTSIEERGQIIAKQKTQNWMTYLPVLEAEIKDFQEKQSVLVNLGGKAEDFLHYIYGVPFSLEKHEFALERIGHLETNLTELISYHYVSHVYRTGKNSLIALHNGEHKQGDV